VFFQISKYIKVIASFAATTAISSKVLGKPKEMAELKYCLRYLYHTIGR